MDWGDLRDAVREDLQDTSENPKYSDELLFTYLNDALADYSQWFPLRVDAATLSGSALGPYTLPADFVSDIWVECPADRFLERRRPRPGIRYPRQSGKPFHYYLQGGSLYLNGSPLTGETVLMTYEALHPQPDTHDDDDHVITVPTADLELIRIYIKAKVMERVRTRQAALDRFKNRADSGSDRQDNPLLPEVEEVYEDYYRKISQRLGGGTIRLYRPGRIR